MNRCRLIMLACALVAGLLGNEVTAVNSIIPGDFDGDGDVDATDFQAFAQCGSGPAVPVFTPCDSMDFDGDGDADQDDFAVFQRCYSGENTPGDPDCAPPPDMVLIPPGEFQMGDTFSEGNSDERPVHTVYLDAFCIQRYQVTNQQYADALNWAYAKGGQITISRGVVYKYNSGESYPLCDLGNSNSYSRITWNFSTFSVVPGMENHPMIMVSWYGAVAYANWRSAMEGRSLGYDLSTWECRWNVGYRLPTEAEWEKAARGGVEGHRFPWSDSDSIVHARANYYSVRNTYTYDVSPTRWYHPEFEDYPHTSQVGYFAANEYGLHDMAGNVYDWCNDWYSSMYYSSSPTNNPHGPEIGTLRVVRGGSWASEALFCRAADRNSLYPDGRYDPFGFRLALSSP